jgi:hypothetical protein
MSSRISVAFGLVIFTIASIALFQNTQHDIYLYLGMVLGSLGSLIGFNVLSVRGYATNTSRPSTIILLIIVVTAVTVLTLAFNSLPTYLQSILIGLSLTFVPIFTFAIFLQIKQ